ncbi:hypothetical protein ABK040_013480 [Willaertia magna]
MSHQSHSLEIHSTLNLNNQNNNLHNEIDKLLNTDTKKYILKFLDIPSLCALDCVSKTFSLSHLCNDDDYWMKVYKRMIEEYCKECTFSFHLNRYDENRIPEMEEKKKQLLQSTTKDYKKNIIKFWKKLNDKMNSLQKHRLSEIKVKKNALLLNRDEILQHAETILKENGGSGHENKEVKSLIIGDKGIGKTAMLYVLGKWAENIKDKTYFPTALDKFTTRVKFNDKEEEEFKLTFIDSPDENNFEFIQKKSTIYSETNIFVLCFSILNLNSYENILEKWIPDIKENCQHNNYHIVLCGTKTEVRNDKKMLYRLLKHEMAPISMEEGKAKAKEIGALAYFEVSSLNGVGFQDLEFLVLLSQIKVDDKMLTVEQQKKKCFIQ